MVAELLSVEDVCRLLGRGKGNKREPLSPAIVLNWINSGQLKAINVAKEKGVGKRPRWRVRPEDLETFLDSRRPDPVIVPDRRRKAKDEKVIQFF